MEGRTVGEAQLPTAGDFVACVQGVVDVVLNDVHIHRVVQGRREYVPVGQVQLTVLLVKVNRDNDVH